MNGIAGGSRYVVVNSTGEDFRSKAPVNEPFLIPHCFKRRSGHSAEYTRHVGAAQCAKTDLSARLIVRITRIEGGAQTRENEERIKVGLKEHIDMDPLT